MFKAVVKVPIVNVGWVEKLMIKVERERKLVNVKWVE